MKVLSKREFECLEFIAWEEAFIKSIPHIRLGGKVVTFAPKEKIEVAKDMAALLSQMQGDKVKAYTLARIRAGYDTIARKRAIERAGF